MITLLGDLRIEIRQQASPDVDHELSLGAAEQLVETVSSWHEGSEPYFP
jgi:hypothetical protein